MSPKKDLILYKRLMYPCCYGYANEANQRVVQKTRQEK